MRKLLGLLLVLALGISMSAKAEIVERDTVAYTGAWKMDKQQTTNSYGEVSVRYVCYLLDIVNSKGEPRKVPTDKATYESDQVTHIIYNVQDSGAKRIAKAVNVDAVNRMKQARASAKAAKELEMADE